ncbi:hypothetical protein NMG60_11024749 [Bertholletia excelsa]
MIDLNSGSTSSVVGDGIIELRECFIFPVTLRRKKKARDNLNKNCLEFCLYEYKIDKATRGQFLGTATINFAEYGIIREKIAIKSISGLTNVEYDNESETASFTDDDSSSYSSRTASSSVFAASPSEKIEIADGKGKGKVQENAQQSVTENFIKKFAPEVASIDSFCLPVVYPELASGRNPQGNEHGLVYSSKKKERQQYGQDKQILKETVYILDNKLNGNYLDGATRKRASLRSETLTFSRRGHELQGASKTYNKLKHMRSVQLPFFSAEASGLIGNRKKKNTSNDLSDGKFKWVSRIEMLEDELREAAMTEAAICTVVSEHGSSTSKVHAAAHCLSGFYLQNCEAIYKDKWANAARAVSLVILDGLTFWLSNSIMLKGIVNQAVGSMLLSDGPNKKTKSDGKGSGGRSSLKHDKLSLAGYGKGHLKQECDNWENALTFIVALEKLEAWIVSRIFELVWWQVLSSFLLLFVAPLTKSKTRGRSSSSTRNKYALGTYEQGNFSIELWKKASKDACERLCPIRAGGHECGCLPVTARLVMEQLIGRLDVAMFNAILHESAEEMPTDPVSDPISDPKVLPILAAKSSYGAGAQMENALPDLFGIDDNEYPMDKYNHNHNNGKNVTPFKPFPLLNALSDIMMLPAELLAHSSTRKEVCPMLGSMLIKRVLSNFVPDEFSPNPIPAALLHALGSEDAQEASEMSVTSFSCIAAPTFYSPPPGASLAGVIGEVGNQTLQMTGSTLLRKLNTSDDKLDELDSLLSAMIIDKCRVSPTEKPNWMPKGGRHLVRFQFLRDVLGDGE